MCTLNEIVCGNLCVTFPQFDGLIILERCRCNNIFGWMTSSAEDHISMTLKPLYNFLALEIPNVD